jgi:hypothetical protein
MKRKKPKRRPRPQPVSTPPRPLTLEDVTVKKGDAR